MYRLAASRAKALKLSELGKANTIGLMKYIHTSNSTVSKRTMCSGVSTTGYMPASRQTEKPFGQNIEMKRGDWICRKCNFMNFAKNMKCLECEDPRPKKQLTGGEWECPQCSFYNYGRNLVCLRCDCRGPGSPLVNNNRFNSVYNGTNNELSENEQKAQRWSSKISEPNNAKDSNNEDFPKMMPLRKTENIHANSRYQNYLSDDIRNKGTKEQAQFSAVETENSASPINIHKQAEKQESWFKKMAELHDVKDETNNTNFVPFVPFPPGYFTKKDDKEKSDVQDSHLKADTRPINSENSNYSVANTNEVPRMHNQPTSSTSQLSGNNVGPAAGYLGKNENVIESNWKGKSLEGSGATEPDPLDMSEEAKAERFFKRVAQIKNISELSQIPDEDFPSIMPMRKGVNRFVVSKRKTPLERRLTSQQHRRNLPIVSSESVKKESD